MLAIDGGNSALIPEQRRGHLRPVNIASSREDQLFTSMTWDARRGTSGARGLSRLTMMLEHTWQLRNYYGLSFGSSFLNLSVGDRVIGRRANPRHTITLSGQASMAGFGVDFAGTWKSGSKLSGSDGETALRISSLMVWKLGVFLIMQLQTTLWFHLYL